MDRKRAASLAADSGGWKVDLEDAATTSSATLFVAEGMAYLDLAASEQSREEAEREHREYWKRLRTAKPPGLPPDAIPLKPPEKKTTASIQVWSGMAYMGLRRDQNAACRFDLSEGLPSLTFYDEKGTERVNLDLVEGQPSLRLSDEKGAVRAALGHVSLKRKDGVVEQLPASSLVLFDQKGTVTWAVPR